MRDVGLTAYSLLVIWVIGLLLIGRFGWFRGQPRTFVYGAALGIGAGALTLILLLASSLTGGLSLIWGYLLLLATVLLKTRSVPEQGCRPIVKSAKRRLGLLEMCLLGALVSIVLAMIASGIFGTLEGDGWAIWGFKAKVFFLNRRIDLAFLRDEARFGFAHLDYPLLLPLVEWWVYAHLGHVNDSVVRLVHVAFYFGLLAAFFGSLRAYVGRTAALLCTVALALLGPATISTLDGYADVILGYYALLGFVSFVAWVDDAQPAAVASAGISLGFGTHVKAEGLSWLLAIAPSLALAVWRAPGASRARLIRLGTFFAISVPVAVIWPLYRWIFGIPLSPIVRLPTLDLAASRLPVVFDAFLSEMGLHWPGSQGWALLWVFTLLGCARAMMSPGPRRRQAVWRWSPVLLQALMVFGFYLLTVAPLKWHLATSLTRVLLQLAPCCLWASAVTLIPIEPFDSNRRDRPSALSPQILSS